MEARVAKAVAALQPVETFPRTAENIAALLYRKIGSPALLDQVREALALGAIFPPALAANPAFRESLTRQYRRLIEIGAEAAVETFSTQD